MPRATGLACLAICLTFSHASPAHPLTPKAELGRQIFFDTRLSEPAGQACGSCHAPNRHFTDPDKRTPTSAGVLPSRFGNRNTPSAMYADHSPPRSYDPKLGMYFGGQFWDGRAATLEEQAKAPFLNPLEMANPDAATVIAKVRAASYAPLFKQVFGPTALDNTKQAFGMLADALAEFERGAKLNRFSSKYDAYLAGTATLTPQEENGLALFEAPEKGGCASCHASQPSGDGTPPLFTDFSYHNLGVPKNPANPFYALPPELNPDGADSVDLGLGGAVGKPEQYGKFKTPSLRNVARTGPYTHNGYFHSLRGLVAFYNSRDVKPACSTPQIKESAALRKGCWPAPEVAANLNIDQLGNLGLSDSEIDAIVAFLLTLTDGYKP